ncbi:hypothetical protein OG249_00090 [Streptomyces microflavus]|uniref:esterase/lipase family protein n=1 Tax=Streptomyces microflavus TaxID=1919 RepID=UPI002252AA75|nr:hypothetical protein [Streptomyces microflavus]MCX4650308.1 hypothetical protein [Streptomyces microflavus]
MRDATSGIWRPGALQSRDVTPDAVIVVPGIMGSELVEKETGKLLWGLKPAMLRRAFGHGGGLEALRATEAELDGTGQTRVKPSALLRIPAWVPLIHGIEPYHDLLTMVSGTVAAPAAVLPFPYDWRLPVEYNGRLLAHAARQHLEEWTATVLATSALRALCQDRMPQMVFVAHSMGGLVTRAAICHQPDLQADTRTVITLGTPFLGSAKTAMMLNGGRRTGGLNRVILDRLQRLTVTLPGVYDLLPDYRCVDEDLEVARLTPQTVARIGGNPYLANASMDFQQKMRLDHTEALPTHRAVVGVAQPTVQSVRIEAGVVQPQYRSFIAGEHGDLRRDEHGIPGWIDRWGDGTVYRDAATLGAEKPVYLPVQHGSLAKNDVALRYIHGVLTEESVYTGPPMGSGEVGLDLPDEGVIAGRAWQLRVTGRDRPVGVRCEIVNTETDAVVATPRLSTRDDCLGAAVTLSEPGLYRVRAQAADTPPVTQLLLAFGVESEERTST